eukprot:650085-Pelagomonas_calceolata.AAC.3
MASHLRVISRRPHGACGGQAFFRRFWSIQSVPNVIMERVACVAGAQGHKHMYSMWLWLATALAGINRQAASPLTSKRCSLGSRALRWCTLVEKHIVALPFSTVPTAAHQKQAQSKLCLSGCEDVAEFVSELAAAAKFLGVQPVLQPGGPVM